MTLAGMLFVILAGAQERHLPALPGWALSGDDSFGAAPDSEVKLAGQPTIRLSSSSATTLGTVNQKVDAAAYAGHRVRFSAAVRTQGVKGWSGLWLRIDGDTPTPLAFENTAAHALRGSVEWTALEIVIDVPADAKEIAFGLLQDGAGSSWFGHFAFAAAEGATLTKRTRGEVRDGGFEGASLGAWFMSGNGRESYRATFADDTKHSGHYSAKLTASGDKTKYGTLMQFVAPSAYVGKRVRAQAWLKSQDVTNRGDFWVRCQGAQSSGDGRGLAGGMSQVDPTSEWSLYETVFDVPAGTVQIQLGVGLLGPGVLWADDISLQIVAADTPLRSGAPLAPRFDIPGGR